MENRFLAPNGMYTNLGLMMSDQCPWEIELYKDSTYLETLKGSAPSQIIKTVGRISAIRRQIADEQDGGLMKFPEMAVSEAVLNAVSHRSYCEECPTMVNVSSNRVVITSPGGHVSLGQDYGNRNRNPALAKVLIEMGFRNMTIKGIPGIVQSYKRS